MKKNIKILTILGILVIMLGTVYGLNLDQDVVMWVDKYPVVQEEYDYFKNKNRALVANYFHDKYRVDLVGDEAWNKSYEEEVPNDMLREKTEEELVRFKQELILLHRVGLIEDINFDKMKEELDKENKIREEMVQIGQVVYGLKTFSMGQYLSYIRENGILQLKEQMKNQVKVDRDELEEYYERVKGPYYSRGLTGKVDVYILKKENLNQVIASEQILEFIQASEGNGNEDEDIKEQIDSRWNVSMTHKVLDINTAEASKGDDLHNIVSEEMQKYQEGEVFKIDEGYYELYIYINKKEDLGMSTFEEVKEVIYGEYIEELYEKYIEELCQNAIIKKP